LGRAGLDSGNLAELPSKWRRAFLSVLGELARGCLGRGLDKVVSLDVSIHGQKTRTNAEKKT
jgi:hypothetical protein